MYSVLLHFDLVKDQNDLNSLSELFSFYCLKSLATAYKAEVKSGGRNNSESRILVGKAVAG